MKRLSSSDSVGVIDGCEERSSQTTHIYSREFQSILDGYEEEDCNEELGRKKRRLSNEKVKALEKHFEAENKLHPKRKVKLASELGLQPRQVAVWFQNRRARWKTKQLEHAFGILKSDYDNLKLSCESLQLDNDALLGEIKNLRDNLKEEGLDTNHLPLEEETVLPEAEKLKTPIAAALDSTELLLDNEGANNNSILILHDIKEGSSDDSDSSAILNEYNGNNSPPIIPAISSSGSLENQIQIWPTPSLSSLRYSCFSSSLFSPAACFQLSDSRLAQNNNGILKALYYQPQQHVKVEEHNFFSTDEACDFFSDEQAPSMNWYCPDQWH